MPDPTLTRYRLNAQLDLLFPEGHDRSFRHAVGDEALVYRCEEADRLIQALREARDAERAQKIVLRDELSAAHGKLLRIDELTAKVGALRRALDAAQPVVREAEALVERFRAMTRYQHALLVEGQTLETACANWDTHPEAFTESSLDLQRLIDAVAAARPQEP